LPEYFSPNKVFPKKALRRKETDGRIQCLTRICSRKGGCLLAEQNFISSSFYYMLSEAYQRFGQRCYATAWCIH